MRLGYGQCRQGQTGTKGEAEDRQEGRPTFATKTIALLAALLVSTGSSVLIILYEVGELKIRPFLDIFVLGAMVLIAAALLFRREKSRLIRRITFGIVLMSSLVFVFETRSTHYAIDSRFYLGGIFIALLGLHMMVFLRRRAIPWREK